MRNFQILKIFKPILTSDSPVVENALVANGVLSYVLLGEAHCAVRGHLSEDLELADNVASISFDCSVKTNLEVLEDHLIALSSLVVAPLPEHLFVLQRLVIVVVHLLFLFHCKVPDYNFPTKTGQPF